MKQHAPQPASQSIPDLSAALNNIDESALDALNKSAQFGGGVQLPFTHAVFWALSGKAAYKANAQACPALYYGGWATASDKWADLEIGVPQGFHEFEGGSGNKTYDGLATRVLSFSMIAKRERWIDEDKGVFRPKYFDGSRRHMQILGMLYLGGQPTVPSILSAKGHQVAFLIEAIGEYEKAIKPHLKALNATRFGVSQFVISIGTTGEFATRSVGKQSRADVTPLVAVFPKDGLTAENVAKRFIGAEMMRANAERLAQAQNWLAAWATPQQADDGGADDEVV